MNLFHRTALLVSIAAAASSVLAVERTGRDSVYAGANAKPFVLNKPPITNDNSPPVDSSGKQVTAGQSGDIVVQRFGRDSVYGASSDHEVHASDPVRSIPGIFNSRPDMIAKKRAAALVPLRARVGSAPTTPSVMPRPELADRQWNEKLDRIRDGISIETNRDRNAIASAAVTVSAVAFGYVIWLLRGGLLLSSLLSTLPAWYTLDPLPILGSAKRPRKNEEQPDSLERLFDQNSPGDGNTWNDPAKRYSTKLWNWDWRASFGSAATRHAARATADTAPT
jgi:hypothetical protein